MSNENLEHGAFAEPMVGPVSFEAVAAAFDKADEGDTPPDEDLNEALRGEEETGEAEGGEEETAKPDEDLKGEGESEEEGEETKTASDKDEHEGEAEEKGEEKVEGEKAGESAVVENEAVKAAGEKVKAALDQAKQLDAKKFFTDAELYYAQHPEALTQQIQAAIEEDPQRATELLAFKQDLTDKMGRFNAMAAQNRQFLNNAVRESMLSVLPSPERVKELDEFVLKAGEGVIGGEDLGAFTTALGDMLVAQGRAPLAHKFMFLLNRLYEQATKGKDLEAVKKEIEEKTGQKAKAKPPRTMKPGAAGQKLKGKAKSFTQKKKAIMSKAGHASLDEWADLFSDLGE